MSNGRRPKPLFWMGSSKRDLMAFPDPVQSVCGYALWLAQIGEKHSDAKPLKGFRTRWKSTATPPSPGEENESRNSPNSESHVST